MTIISQEAKIIHGDKIITCCNNNYRYSLTHAYAPFPPKIGPGTRRPVPVTPKVNGIAGPRVVEEVRRREYMQILALSNQHLSDNPPVPALLTEAQAIFWRDWSLERLWQLEMLALARSSPAPSRRQRGHSSSRS